jgi:signal transduction histidine kinase
MVVADSDRVKQVLLNLISNAVKFTPDQSTISVSVSPQQGSVLVAVVDKGPGISEENQPRLFQRFSRLEGPGGVRMPGSGLGLYLSRSIIEAHGGDIWVDSEPGKGSTFAFRLPRLAQQKLPGT